MSRATERLQGQVAELEWQLSEARRELAMHKQSAQRLCNTIRENQGKPHGDAMTVGSAWATAQYISGETGPAPWAKQLEPANTCAMVGCEKPVVREHGDSGAHCGEHERELREELRQ